MRTENLITLLAVEKLDKEDGTDNAIKVISDPKLDRKELAALLEDSLMGRVVNKETGEAVKMSKETFMAGCLNLINGFDHDIQEDSSMV